MNNYIDVKLFKFEKVIIINFIPYQIIMRNVPDLHDMESERNIPEITISYDLEKDVQNRRAAKNKFSNFKTYEDMEPHEQEILNSVIWLSFNEAREILLPYLSARYERQKKRIDEKVKNMKIVLDKQKEIIFENMEKLTKRPIYLNKFTIRGTTCIRWPYNPETWEIWKYIFIKPEWMERNCAHAFAHELLHMQTHKYYQHIPPMNQLNHQQFNLIKESLTFLLNHEFPWVNMAADRWYPNHQEFRKILEDYRLSCWDKKDFEDLIKFGCDYILKNGLLTK